jgi:plastocyanin
LRFAPSVVQARPGEVLRLRFANADGVTHDWSAPTVPGAHVVAPAGRSSEVVFKAPAAGLYPVICTIPGHKEGGMVGMLIVE